MKRTKETNPSALHRKLEDLRRELKLADDRAIRAEESLRHAQATPAISAAVLAGVDAMIREEVEQFGVNLITAVQNQLFFANKGNARPDERPPGETQKKEPVPRNGRPKRASETMPISEAEVEVAEIVSNDKSEIEAVKKYKKWLHASGASRTSVQIFLDGFRLGVESALKQAQAKPQEDSAVSAVSPEV